MSLQGTPAKIGNEWGGVRVKEPANPGDIVTVQTKAGNTWNKRLVAVERQYPDAVVWTVEDVDGNGSTGPAPATGPTGPPAGAMPAQPAPVASAGPAGPVTTSGMVQAALSAYADALAAGWPDEQAGSLAVCIAIQVGRGAVNDLIDHDPFAGN